MKKTLLIGSLFLAVATLVISPGAAFGGEEKSCAKKCQVTTCPFNQKADTTAKAQVDKAPAGHDCDYTGKCEFLALNVAGLKDADGETEITRILADEKGVVKVCSVDAKSGLASLCYNPDLINAEALADMVIKAGYKAKIEPGAVKPCSSPD